MIRLDTSQTGLILFVALLGDLFYGAIFLATCFSDVAVILVFRYLRLVSTSFGVNRWRVKDLKYDQIYTGTAVQVWPFTHA